MLLMFCFSLSGGGSTSKLRMNFEARALRSCAQNAVAISVGLLLDPTNERIFRIVGAVTKPVLEWDTDHRSKLRCASACEKFMVEQSSGFYMKHVAKVAGTMANLAALQNSGFETSKEEAAKMSIDDLELRAEDDFADMFGQFTWNLVQERLKRGLFMMRGYPWSLLKMLSGVRQAADAWALFKKDRENYQSLKTCANRTAEADQMLRRSLFNKTSVVQLMMAADDHRGDTNLHWARDMRSMLSEHALVAVPSLMIEDMIGTMKGTKTKKRGNKYGRPQRGMGMVIRKHVVDKRHKFMAPTTDLPVGGKTTGLTKPSFHPMHENRSLPWNDIVGTKDPAPFYSPRAEMFSHNIADMVMLEAARKAGDINMVQQAWVGEVANVAHRLLLGMPSAGGADDHRLWFHVFYHYPQSAVLAWPGVLEKFGNHIVFVHNFDINQPVLLGLHRLDNIKACTFEWRAPLWQEKNMAGGMMKPHRIVAAIEHGPAPVLECMARKAFWRMSRTQVSKFATLHGTEVPGAASLVDALQLVVQAVLGMDAAAALQVVSQRLGADDLPATWADEVLSIDEAAQVLDRPDAEALGNEQKELRNMEEGRDHFRREYRKKKFDVRAMAESKMTAAAKKKAKAKSAPSPLPSGIAQKDVKVYCPPGAYIWRSNGRPQWNGHLPPRRRVHGSWSAETGEDEGVKDCLKKLWLQYLDQEGLGIDSCPWKELIFAADLA